MGTLNISFHGEIIKISVLWLSWMHCLTVEQVTRLILLGPATFFHGDYENIFYHHSLPYADSRRAVVSFW